METRPLGRTGHKSSLAIFGAAALWEGTQPAADAALVRPLGITGHGYRAPAVHAAPLERFDFETVMTPLNFVQWADPAFRAAAERLLTIAAEKAVGVLVIKAFTRAPWGDRPHKYTTWYEPFGDDEAIEGCLRFVLAKPVAALTTPGDLRLLPAVLQAAERFRPLSETESEALVASAQADAPLFSSACH